MWRPQDSASNATRTPRLAACSPISWRSAAARSRPPRLSGDAFEAGVSDRLQFLVQSAAETDCCNRVFHVSSELFGQHPDGKIIHLALRGSFPLASVKSTHASM